MDEPGFSCMKWCVSSVQFGVQSQCMNRCEVATFSKVKCEKKRDGIVVAATASATRISKTKASTKMVSSFFLLFCCRFAAAAAAAESYGIRTRCACTSGTSRWKVYRFFAFIFLLLLEPFRRKQAKSSP